MATSDPPSSVGHRAYLRSASLSDLDEGDLYSAVLLAASDSMNIGLTPAERAMASSRKAAAMKEIESREALRGRWTPPGGIERTAPPSVRR